MDVIMIQDQRMVIGLNYMRNIMNNVKLQLKDKIQMAKSQVNGQQPIKMKICCYNILISSGGWNYEQSRKLDLDLNLQKFQRVITILLIILKKCQIIIEIKGKKSGQWIKKLRKSCVEQFQIMQINLKIGEWIDIDSNYELYFNSQQQKRTNQITYCGEQQNVRNQEFGKQKRIKQLLEVVYIFLEL
ncbi:unnamed protein product [Paramecium sonneborni]|uniref:Uncharacterized protein n=1 Tax=Paramecium sonneborni TaxID=65129 RepID=A0A8S1RME4_9CILI|nr:unnamed protein product [Paramecium sonneborni]